MTDSVDRTAGSEVRADSCRLEKAGGQAVIEGVMMRSSTRAAVAVRTPDGSIAGRILDAEPLASRNPVWRRPVLRGAASLFDSLRMGMSALNWSAEIAEPAGKKGKGGGDGSFLSFALGLLLAAALFGWLPIRLGMLIGNDNHVWINLLAGLFRIAGFFAYVAAISLLPEIRRVFVFHGAEHQTIHAWEGGAEDLAGAAGLADPRHQRCGTSFIFLVMLLAVAFYSIVDSAVALATGSNPAAHWRMLYHLPLLPVVMGISYEILRIVDRNLEKSALARALAWPGLLLQKFTTRRAGPAEVEVAVAALKLAVGADPGPAVRMVATE